MLLLEIRRASVAGAESLSIFKHVAAVASPSRRSGVNFIKVYTKFKQCLLALFTVCTKFALIVES
jgi:hypothetical protein